MGRLRQPVREGQVVTTTEVDTIPPFTEWRISWTPFQPYNGSRPWGHPYDIPMRVCPHGYSFFPEDNLMPPQARNSWCVGEDRSCDDDRCHERKREARR